MLLILSTMWQRRSSPTPSVVSTPLEKPVKAATVPSKRHTWLPAVLVVLVVGCMFASLSPAPPRKVQHTSVRGQVVGVSKEKESKDSSDSRDESKDQSDDAYNDDVGGEPVYAQTPKPPATVISNEVPSQCTVWMAPSSLIGVQGFGIFTTRDIPANGHILKAPDGVSVPIEAYSQKVPKDVEPWKKDWIRVWDNYWWGRGVPDHVNYDAPPDNVDYQVSFGALPNHNCLLDTISNVYAVEAYQDQLVDRFRDPGAGAFSYSMGREFIVTKDVTAGQELFLSYGYCKHDHDPEWTDYVVMPGDLKEAADLILDKKLVVQDGRLEPPKGTSELVQRVLPTTQGERTSLLLKARSSEVKDPTKALVMTLAREKTIQPRSVEWIRENGFCLENLIPQKSRIAQAGHGGFAQYGVKKGELIVPAPLLHIMNKTALNLYDDEEHPSQQTGTQLLVNYCMGHRESSLLVCPDTAAVLINHCSNRTQDCGPNGPNAYVRWSTGWDIGASEWLAKPLQELAKQDGRFLSMEVVALRDIAPGEEVFLDYGVEWEEAWKTHVQTWQPRPAWNSTKPFVRAHDANLDPKQPIFDYMISGDLRKTVKHPYLFTACQYYAGDEDEDEVYQKKNPDWKNMTDKEILEMYASDGFEYAYEPAIGYHGYSSHGDMSHFPCAVLKEENREGDDIFYTVRIFPSPWEEQPYWDENRVPRLLRNYPRHSIHYFVQPHRSDQHMPGVFRHPIGVPDDIFPEQWKDLKKR